MTAPPTPFVDRPWWRRALTGIAYGMSAAAIVIALELLVGDIQGGRAVSKYGSVGIPLWPYIVRIAVVIPLIGVLVTLIAPLYKRRHGTVMVAVVSTVGIIVLMLLFDVFTMKIRWYEFVEGGLSWWKEWIVLSCFLIIAVTMAESHRANALGESSEDSTDPGADGGTR